MLTILLLEAYFHHRYTILQTDLVDPFTSERQNVRTDKGKHLKKLIILPLVNLSK